MGGKKKKSKKKTAKDKKGDDPPADIDPLVVETNTTNKATFLNTKDGDNAQVENKLNQMKEDNAF